MSCHLKQVHPLAAVIDNIGTFIATDKKALKQFHEMDFSLSVPCENWAQTEQQENKPQIKELP
jgi:hypothetical protein